VVFSRFEWINAMGADIKMLAAILIKTTKKLLTILFFLLISSENLLSQNLNEKYMLLSNPKKSSEYIEFKNDSILVRKPHFAYFGCGLAKLEKTNQPASIYREYKYNRKEDVITIYEFENGENVKFKITNNQYFENSQRKEIYVKRNEFDGFPDLAVTYNDKVYWLDSPKTSSGMLIKGGKKNRKLAKILKNKKTENLEVKIYIEYEAFEKFGFKYVFGIIEIKDKNNK
jgi:hypothetical protein